jgi:hypothetical protein
MGHHNVTNSGYREKAIKNLMMQFSQCNGRTFDCPDSSMQVDKFEQESPLDLKQVSKNQDISVKFLLRIRARINFRMKIAEAMLKRLANYSTTV